VKSQARRPCAGLAQLARQCEQTPLSRMAPPHFGHALADARTTPQALLPFFRPQATMLAGRSAGAHDPRSASCVRSDLGRVGGYEIDRAALRARHIEWAGPRPGKAKRRTVRSARHAAGRSTPDVAIPRADVGEVSNTWRFSDPRDAALGSSVRTAMQRRVASCQHTIGIGAWRRHVPTLCPFARRSIARAATRSSAIEGLLFNHR